MERNQPAQHILDLRDLFSFVTAKQGEIDQDICDGIGQMHVLGLLDGHPIDALDLRNAGRFWGNHYAALLTNIGGAGSSGFERMGKSHDIPRETRDDRKWDRMDAALTGRQRAALTELLTAPSVSSEWLVRPPFWQAIVDEALLAKHGRVRKNGAVRMPGAVDHDLFADAIEGLFVLYDCGITNRWERAA